MVSFLRYNIYNIMISREDIFKYVNDKYDITEDYPFPAKAFSSYSVLRHSDNHKWFALIMDIPRNKLGLAGSDKVDVINIKLTDPHMISMVLQQDGFFPAYHMNHRSWVSIIMDGAVPLAEICQWLDDSFMTTASKETKLKYRAPKEWLIPANPKYFDIQKAFSQANEIDWKQSRGIKVDDMIFMYVGAPVSAILYKCEVIQTGIPYCYNDGHVQMTTLMRIKLLRQYPPDKFTLDIMASRYGVRAVRGPRGIPYLLSEALKD